MFGIFKNNMPIENYIKGVLVKNKLNMEFAFKEIYLKYPMLKKKSLYEIIASILEKQIKGDKISGFWKKINSKWVLYNEIESNEIKGENFSYSGADLPASEESNSMGNNLGTYSRPQGQPRNNALPEPHMQHDPSNVADENKCTDLQNVYNTLFDQFKLAISDTNKLNQVILEELMKEYGSNVVRIKLRDKI